MLKCANTNFETSGGVVNSWSRGHMGEFASSPVETLVLPYNGKKEPGPPSTLWTTASEKFLAINFCVQVFQNFALGSIRVVKMLGHKF